MSRTAIHRPSVTPNSAIDLMIATYKRDLRTAATIEELNARHAAFNTSELRLHLHQSEQDDLKALIAQRRQDLGWPGLTRLEWIVAVTRLWCVSPMTCDQLIEAIRPLLTSLSPDEKRAAWEAMNESMEQHA